MPYLPQSRKDELASGGAPADASDLTYLFTETLRRARSRQDVFGGCGDAIARFQSWRRLLRFADYAMIVGSLQCARLEHTRRTDGSQIALLAIRDIDIFMTDFYMQQVAPYEDKKIEENGDLYDDADRGRLRGTI